MGGRGGRGGWAGTAPRGRRTQGGALPNQHTQAAPAALPAGALCIPLACPTVLSWQFRHLPSLTLVMPTPESVMVSVLLVLSGTMWMYSSGLLSSWDLSVSDWYLNRGREGEEEAGCVGSGWGGGGCEWVSAGCGAGWRGVLGAVGASQGASFPGRFLLEVLVSSHLQPRKVLRTA